MLLLGPPLWIEVAVWKVLVEENRTRSARARMSSEEIFKFKISNSSVPGSEAWGTLCHGGRKEMGRREEGYQNDMIKRARKAAPKAES